MSEQVNELKTEIETGTKTQEKFVSDVGERFEAINSRAAELEAQLVELVRKTELEEELEAYALKTELETLRQEFESLPKLDDVLLRVNNL